ncbi:MFS transporter [Streptomyces sp. BBFR102]|uniref:MFS transporter n=1 Tax=Streptomyces sp. BBFR102 TaxID=3448171 RepID=UPI003F53B084
MGWSAGRVLRDHNAGLYLGGVVVSSFGSSAMSLAAGVWAKSLTGSSSLAALTTLCVWAPTLIGPLVGPLADRVRRQPLLVLTNLAMAALLLTLLAVRSGDQLWILFTVLTVYGVSAVLLDAAEVALVAAAVPKDLRGDFNGLRMTANESMKLIAPLLGAGLFVQFGGAAVAALDAATFALAAGAFALLRVTEPAPTSVPVRRWTAQVTEGVRALGRHPGLRRVVLAGAATMFMAGLNGASVYAVVDAGLHRSPAFAGVLYTAQGIGSVLSGLAAGALLRRMPERTFAAAGIALFALGVALRAAPSSSVALIASAMIGLGLPCVLIAAMTAVQREIPAALLGRVAATANTVLFAPNALGLGIGAWLIAVADHRLLLIAAGAAAGAAALYCLVSRPARLAASPQGPRADSSAPDTGSDANGAVTAPSDSR